MLGTIFCNTFPIIPIIPIFWGTSPGPPLPPPGLAPPPGTSSPKNWNNWNNWKRIAKNGPQHWKYWKNWNILVFFDYGVHRTTSFGARKNDVRAREKRIYFHAHAHHFCAHRVKSCDEPCNRKNF